MAIRKMSTCLATMRAPIAITEMKIAISKETKIILTLHKVIKIKIMMRKCKKVKMITLLMLKSTPMKKVKHSRMKKNRENKKN
jgi:hypothetical protein